MRGVKGRSFRTVALGLTLLVWVTARAAALELLPALTATAAILLDSDTNEVLYARNPDLPLPPASTTKIVTSYLALSSGRLDETVRVSRYATTMQPSKIWLKPGWELSVRDLTYAVLLNSANDASVVLAEGLGGSVPHFARMMTETAHQLGATRSRFVNPSGLPAEGHYSTARDLTTLLQHALQVPGFRAALSTPTTVIQPRSGSKRRIQLRSHNRMLANRDIRVIGKTGYTKKAKRCFVGAASNGERELLLAVLGSNDLWGDLRRLVDHGFRGSAPLPAVEARVDWQAAEAAAASAEASSGVGDQVAPPQTQYHVRLASFRSRSRATSFQKRVHGHGYRAVVERLLANRRPLYRVTIRGLTSRAEAKEAATRLGKAYRLRPQIIGFGS